MDRTVIGPWKAEERELSVKLFKKLYALTLLYPASEDFRKCFSDEMFLKPNQQAFFQVMHFLFRVLDPTEYKKRFYWPITDKRSEAIFRSSTVEYLKHLNEKHQLGWTNIKSYLVVMPGGMKFINFMLELVGFIVKEITRQREKELSSEIEAGKAAELNLDGLRQQNEFFKEFASGYINAMESEITKSREMVQLLKEILANIALKNELSIDQLLDEQFHADLEAENEKLLKEMFINRRENIISLEQPLAELAHILGNNQFKEKPVNCDKVALVESLKKINELFPAQTEENYDLCSNDEINVKALISALNRSYPLIKVSLAAANKEFSVGEHMSSELSSLLNELRAIEEIMTEFKQRIHKKRTNEPKDLTLTSLDVMVASDATPNALMTKFIYTPPIKFEALECNRSAKMRLPLLGDMKIKQADNILVPRSVRKMKHAESSNDLNNTMNKSKIIGPMELLRTISKNTASISKSIAHNNMSSLGKKWKGRQINFANDLVDPFDSIRCEKSPESGVIIQREQPAYSPVLQSAFTPCRSSDLTRVTCLEFSDVSSNSTLLFSKKFFAVKKVQNESLNLSTSPSGRLDALVTFEVPKFESNNKIISQHNFAEDHITTAIKRLSLTENNANVENDANVCNRELKCLPNLPANLSGDNLFDTSDSVLQDLTM